MKLETRISFIEQLENKIIRVEIKPDIILEIADLDENFNVYKQLLGTKKGLFLLVFKHFGESNEETREKFASESRAKIKLAEALVVETIPHRMSSNIYIKWQKPSHPVKIFSEEISAINWLLSKA